MGIIDHTYWLFPSVKLYVFEIIAIIAIVFGLATIVYMMAKEIKILETDRVLEKETDHFIISQIPNTTKLSKQIVKLNVITAILLGLGIISLVIFAGYSSMAKKYGAYENVHLSQTLLQIKSSIDNGFIESENIPEEPKGSILIFFKYGCPDCTQIHDDLEEYLLTHNVTNYYYVSSRSKQGKALIEKYPITEVPSGVYVKEKDSSIAKNITMIIYRKTDKDSPISTFDTEAFEFLITNQNKHE